MLCNLLTQMKIEKHLSKQEWDKIVNLGNKNMPTYLESI